MSSSRWRRRPQRGAAAVEFAFVGALFFALIFSALDFGYAFMLRENMVHAAQEGLRQALVQPDDASRDSTAVSTAQARMAGVVGTSLAKAEGVLTCPQAANAGGALDVCTNYDPVTTKTFPLCNDQSGKPIANTECITITLKYDYRDHSLVNIPGIDSLLPPQLGVTATQRIK